MTTVLQRPSGPPDSPNSLRRRRVAYGDRSFRALTMVAGLLVLVILALIAVVTTQKAWPAFSFAGLRLVFGKVWDPTNAHLGGLPLVYGTFITSIIAVVVAVPVSLGLALFMTELAPPRVRTPTVYLIDILAAVPSVVYGLWGIFFLATPLTHFYTHVSSALSGIWVLDAFFHGTPPQGRSYFTAGLIVAMMIVPIITSLTREVFATVPRSQKEVALALGATRWEMMRTSILGYGRSGVVGAVMLGLGRAMGETIAVALVIGSVQHININLFNAGDSIAANIANNFGESSNAFGNSGHVPFQAALIALGVILFVFTIIINVIARAFIARSERRTGIR